MDTPLPRGGGFTAPSGVKSAAEGTQGNICVGRATRVYLHIGTFLLLEGSFLDADV